MSAPSAQQLSDGVYCLRGSISNCGLVYLGEGSYVLIDSLGDADEVRTLATSVAPGMDQSSGIYSVATHYHWDHTAGVTAWPQALGIATRETRERLQLAGSSYLNRDHEDRFEKADAESGHWPGLPMIGLDGSLRIHGSERSVSIVPAPLPAHTASDCIAVVEPDGVVFCGDLWFHDVFPVLDRGGSLRGWRQDLRWLSSMATNVTGEAVLVPGHGVVADPDALGSFVEYLGWVSASTTPDDVAAVRAKGTVPQEFAHWARAERHVQLLLRRDS